MDQVWGLCVGFLKVLEVKSDFFIYVYCVFVVKCERSDWLRRLVLLSVVLCDWLVFKGDDFKFERKDFY